MILPAIYYYDDTRKSKNGCKSERKPLKSISGLFIILQERIKQHLPKPSEIKFHPVNTSPTFLQKTKKFLKFQSESAIALFFKRKIVLITIVINNYLFLKNPELFFI